MVNVEEVKITRIVFRYPSVIPEGDKRSITIKSGYLASASLRSSHKVVYRNLIRKYTIEGVKNTTNRAMSELNKRYPERYQELRVEFQKEMVKKWYEVHGSTGEERVPVTSEDMGMQRGQTITQVVTPEDKEYPEVRKSPGGFFTRLFRRGL